MCWKSYKVLGIVVIDKTPFTIYKEKRTIEVPDPECQNRI